jgi:protoporphyrinogen oxidase
VSDRLKQKLPEGEIMATVSILGGGLAGMSAAQRCRQRGSPAIVYEKNSHLGGHASSMSRDGFVFDEGPHVSFTKNEAVKTLFAEAVGGAYRDFPSIVNNYWKGHWIKHPAQVNLHGLPPDLVSRCLVDYVQAYFAPEATPADYGEWLYAQFGKTFSDEFPYRYTRKYWTVEPSQMATDWIGPRMYKPKLDEVFRGALGPVEQNLHYITQFRYPSRGGFGSYVRAVDSDADVRLSHSLELIDTSRKRLSFGNGRVEDYDRLISSLPLPELIRRIKDCPAEVKAAADKLVCTSVALVDVGVERSEGFPEGHWLYFYDEDICFSRASYPHLLSSNNVPAGCGSIQVEIYHTRFKGPPSEDLLSLAIEDMRKVGMLRSDDRIKVAQHRNVPYGNVLFDLNRTTALAVVNGYLKEIGIICCGRYGLWGYHWTDESIVSGWEAADFALGSGK